MTSLLQAAVRARCRLFGAFSIEGPQGPVRIRGRRARALLAYLAFAGAAGASRERLSGLLWSDRGDDQARASLRQCLLELRRELADAGIDALEVGRETGDADLAFSTSAYLGASMVHDDRTEPRVLQRLRERRQLTPHDRLDLDPVHQDHTSASVGIDLMLVVRLG